MSRAAAAMVLSEEERTTLERWVRSRTTPQGLAQRSRIVLEAATGASNRIIAQRWHLNLHTVGTWRSRFATTRLVGLHERPGRGRPRRYPAPKVQAIVAATLRLPADATHWSARRLARQVGVSHMTVHRIWRAFDLKPHQTQTFKFSRDPQLTTKLLDVVGLSLHPPANALVLSLDAKTQLQALERSQPLLPLRPGAVARRTHDYARHGTLDLFAALNVGTGNVLVSDHRRHRHQEVLVFLRRVERAYPTGEIHFVLDNASTYTVPKVERWFRRRPRFHRHPTPTGASWLNQLEAWFSILSRRAIRRGSVGSVAQLRAAIERFLTSWNADAKPFAWVKTPEQILCHVQPPL
ncbi:MAG: IS630 family transposase [Candidatus Omnitrophica bacterium]|nr:IS630 family transposase [Candidatus Omnitrophota bacterium]